MPARKVASKQSNNPGDQKNTYGGRVISVKLGHKTRRICIDGSADTIIRTIKSVFGLRTKRAFWLEDVDNIVRIIDRDMPVGSYTLHQDEGLVIKMSAKQDTWYDPSPTVEDKIFYSEDDFCEFLSRQGWTCLRDRKYSSKKFVLMHELPSGGIYYGSEN